MPSVGGCEEGQRGTLCAPRAMLVEGGELPPLRILESKGQAEVEHGEPHVQLSKHSSVSTGTLLGWRRQVTLGELEYAVAHAHGLRALAGREPPWPPLVSVVLQRVLSGVVAFKISRLGWGP